VNTRDLFDLGGKAAIVTGGGTGIGRQLAQGLAELGADLVLCARKADRCEQAARELRAELGVRAIGLACDVRDPAAVEAVVERTVAELGRVDILVNNAGTTWGAPPEDLPLDAWRKVIDVNLTGVFLFAQAAGRRMIEQGQGGRIVNIASIAGKEGNAGMLAYSTSKAAVIGLTKTIGKELAETGITCNAIAPAVVRTAMVAALPEAQVRYMTDKIPMKRTGEIHELAALMAYIASPECSFTTAFTFDASGGRATY